MSVDQVTAPFVRRLLADIALGALVFVVGAGVIIWVYALCAVTP